MESVIRLNLKNLKPEDRRELELFTEPQFRCCLDGIDPYGISNAVIVAVGAPKIGLALASVHPDLNFAIIHSIQADDSLFKGIEEELIKEKVETVSFQFYDDGKISQPLWDALKKHQWFEPELVILKYFLHHTFNPSWLNKQRPFPKEFQEFPWKKLKLHEKQNLLWKEAHERFPLQISPFFSEDIEYLNSLGLRHGKEVIGWMITHRIAPDTISYRSLYIEPKYQFRGYSIHLLADAIKIQKKHKIPYGVFEINIDQSSGAWLRLIEKRLAPYTFEIVKKYKTWKRLG